MAAIQSMLSAVAFGSRVTIGQEALPELRCLSNARALGCPACGGPVVLKAGAILAPHFAHLPGASCSHGDAEPETERHREGKAMLARWVRERAAEAVVTLEAILPETGQRADILVELPDGRRIAIEYQCADLGAREWRRRHDLYRSASVADLWLLGGNRLVRGESGFRLTELERELVSAKHLLLFVDSLGENLPAGHLARLRVRGDEPAAWVTASLSARPLAELDLPWHLLEAPNASPPEPASKPRRSSVDAGTTPVLAASAVVDTSAGDATIFRWLRLKHGVDEAGLPGLFGLPAREAEAFACSARAWQAAVYYRWIHGRIGEPWSLDEVDDWARRRLPLAAATGRRITKALTDFQDLLSAAGLLSIPRRGRARVVADLLALGRVPDPEEVQRVAAYRRTRKRDD